MKKNDNFKSIMVIRIIRTMMIKLPQNDTIPQ